jgi:hypothetical protein
MTETRGRALILSNKHEVKDNHGQVIDWRKGADIDHDNMRNMLENFGFVVNGEYKSYTSQVIHSC